MKQTLLIIVAGLGLWAAPAGLKAGCTANWTGTSMPIVEAESGALSGGAALITTDPNDNGNSVEFTNNGNSGDACGTSGCISITFTAPFTTNYKVELRLLAPNNNSDSLYITMLQGGSTLNDLCGDGTRRDSFPQSGNYAWYWMTDDQNSTQSGNARIWALTGGTNYTLQIKAREDDLRVDQVRIRYQQGGTPTYTATATQTPTRTRTPTQGSATATRTFTPTRTPTPATPYWQGLSGTSRLYDLEYIPFPQLTSGGNNIYDLAMTFTTAALNAVPKNTARWRIEFVGLTATAGNQIQVETRLGLTDTTCVSGYYDPNDYLTATQLTLPVRPQNLSTTYFWISPSAVPLTEQFDAMGDPRFTPYLDMLNLPAGQAYAGGYNWFFRDLSTDASGTVYRNFATSADYSNYNGVSADAPKLYKLWREGIINSRSVYTSLTGWSDYYIGFGGEIGGDANNYLNGGVYIYRGPWNASGAADHNDIGGANGALMRLTGTGSAGWTSKPWLGELWPDGKYSSDWAENGSMASWGNLRNAQQSGGAYRDLWSNVDTTAFPLSNQDHTPSGNGCGSFMNGGGGGAVFNHGGYDGQNGDIMADASAMSAAYHFSSPAVFQAWRPWGLARGNTQPEWALAPYSGARPVYDIYQDFYDSNSGGANIDRSSAAIRGVLNGTAGYFILNGLSPSGDTGINFIARFAIISCLRTFHEAGVPTRTATANPFSTKNIVSSVPHRIEPVPLIRIKSPTLGYNTFNQGAVVQVAWVERYARWDYDRYTADYPCVDDAVTGCTPADPKNPQNPALEWHGSEPLGYNLKYSPNGGGTWYSVLTGLTCSAGVLLDGADMIDAVPGQYNNSYAWSTSVLSPGTNLLRVECYRKNLPQHLAYHEIPVEITP